MDSTLTGCIMANVGNGVAQTTNFFHSKRADAIIQPKISPNGDSVIGVGRNVYLDGGQRVGDAT